MTENERSRYPRDNWWYLFMKVGKLRLDLTKNHEVKFIPGVEVLPVPKSTFLVLSFGLTDLGYSQNRFSSRP